MFALTADRLRLGAGLVRFRRIGRRVRGLPRRISRGLNRPGSGGIASGAISEYSPVGYPAGVKLSDGEERELARLERVLRAADPALDRRLSGMRRGGPASLHVVLVLGAMVAVGVSLVAVGDLRGIGVCLIAGLVLTAIVPAAAIVWWAGRYYCRYCAGKWPAPASTCPRCDRPIRAG